MLVSVEVAIDKSSTRVMDIGWVVRSTDASPIRRELPQVVCPKAYQCVLESFECGVGNNESATLVGFLNASKAALKAAVANTIGYNFS